MIIKIHVSNALNTTDRVLTLDMISGRALRDYAFDIKEGDVIGTVDSLTNLFGYFKVMCGCHSKLRYFDWDGQVHLAKGRTSAQAAKIARGTRLRSWLFLLGFVLAILGCC